MQRTKHYEWRLNFFDRQKGAVCVLGRVDGDRVIFETEEEGSVLNITIERALEICAWSHPEQRKRLNGWIDAQEVFVPRLMDPTPVLTEIRCDHCKSTVTRISEDFDLHAIPWCENWRRKQ